MIQKASRYFRFIKYNDEFFTLSLDLFIKGTFKKL